MKGVGPAYQVHGRQGRPKVDSEFEVPAMGRSGFRTIEGCKQPNTKSDFPLVPHKEFLISESGPVLNPKEISDLIRCEPVETSTTPVQAIAITHMKPFDDGEIKSKTCFVSSNA
jgi:hypothetical protein